VVAVEVATQASALIIGVLAAWWWGSVWALVAASLLSQVIQVILLHLWLPGPANRLRWEPAAARELIGFGKWVFLSTACGFLIGQADKVLIGQWLSLGDFGLYTIAFFLAAFPFLMGSMVMGRVLIPAIRQNPPGENARNFARYRRFRALGTGGLLSMVALLALFGPALVDLMYDPRYQGAGGMVVMLAAVQAPAIVILTCDQVALARGDSRRFFWFTLARGLLVVAGIALGLQMAGLMGGILGLGLANLAAYPVLAWLLRPHGAWDPLHDGAAYAGGLVIFCFAIWYNAPAIAALSAITPG
jgi:O-antigen/teichoic acid export membrane protein